MISVLPYQNWNYMIPFDNYIYKEVCRHLRNYTEEEQIVYKKLIRFYRTNYSLQQVIDAFNKLTKEEQIIEFKKSVIKRSENILYLPFLLKDYYVNLINNEYKSHKKFFMLLLNKALSKPAINAGIDCLKLKLGKYYKKTIKISKHYSKRKIDNKDYSSVYSEFPAKLKVEQTLNNLIKNKPAQLIFGVYNPDKSDVQIVNENGNGRFVPGVISNKLFINTNGKQLVSDNDICYQCYLNVYPGKRHFYKSVDADFHKKPFDCGSNFLINGWSFFTATHYKPDNYTRKIKSLYNKIVQLSMSKHFEKGLVKLNILLLGLFPKNIATQYLIDITSYLGKFESYPLGAITTELLIDSGFATSPKDLLNKYKDCNIADFFGFYEEKIVD